VIAEIFIEGYSGILRRGYWREFASVVKHVCISFTCVLVYLFVMKYTSDLSRLFMILFFFNAVILTYAERLLWKIWLKYHRGPATGKRSIMLVGDEENCKKMIDAFSGNQYSEFIVTGMGIISDNASEDIPSEYRGIKLIYGEEKILSYILANWVDEVMLDIPKEEFVSVGSDFIEKCSMMGVTTHINLEQIVGKTPYHMVEKIQGYNVLSNSVSAATAKQLFFKRLMDIIGGISGCLITLILTIFIGPIIYIKSPGPIFFTQERVGRNGRKFKIYKFRSMYMDAEERKKELMAKNNIKDGMMFKMDDDPRIIKGIGKFIRDTSIDEFPQFWNVLKGDMSLIGTRPPTVDEWEKYEFEHRGRLAIKPGITGMWQVSGRSDIKDFDEVVRLDKQYISQWNLGLDFRILLKTVLVVLKKDGAQ
jgi:exopolysaccharide biosynthesis polyprenyl glycosylphosphotransferase